MEKSAYKFHTNTFDRLVGVMQKAMYGITKNTFNSKKMPSELKNIKNGDIIFISEFLVSKNALFGPYYVVDNREGIVGKHHGAWIEIDEKNSDTNELAYWVSFEKYNFCVLFDKFLAQDISVVWPHHWRSLNVNLPSWGKISEDDTEKLLEFCIKNEHQEETRAFLKRHSIF